jgi:apolipoprotein D and lipocalin family protein
MFGRAVPDPADTEHTNAKLKVRFPVSPVDGDYWVVRLDQSYSYVVVGSPSYNFMWIMYRSPRMPTELYNTIIEDLKKDDFPV